MTKLPGAGIIEVVGVRVAVLLVDTIKVAVVTIVSLVDTIKVVVVTIVVVIVVVLVFGAMELETVRQ